jgi:hypothetical protein
LDAIAAAVTAESIRWNLSSSRSASWISSARPVPNPESLDQCLERAMIAVMTELDIEHVVRDGQGMGGRLVSKTNFASGSMDFRMIQADPTRSISGRVRSPWVSIVTNCRSTCDDCKESASDWAHNDPLRNVLVWAL